MRKSLVASMVAVSALALASCAMPADDPNYAGASGAFDQVDSAVASANAADQADMTDALVPPTSIGVDAPLAAAPEAGAAIVSFTDGSEYQAVFQTALAEAADALGWTVETVQIDPADPTSMATAFDEAVAKAPAGIHITGDMADALATNLPAAQAAGIQVVCTGCSANAPVDGVADISIDGTEQNTTWGNVLASYVFNSQYDGEDASAQIFSLPGGALADFNIEFSSSLADQCRNCGSTESFVDPTFMDVTDPVAVSDFISSEMSTALGSWAVLDSGSLSTDGLADTLANDPLLLSPVVVVGRGAAASDIAALQALAGSAPTPEASPAAGDVAAAESEAPADATASDAGAELDAGFGGRTPEEAAALQAWIGIPQPVMAWRVIDQFARLIGGDEPATGPLPSQLLTTGNASDAVLDENGNFVGIADYQDQFKALWGVQ